jgi:flagellin
MSVINTNIKSLVAQDSITKNERTLSTNMQRLSTGVRINSAKDDAAGLAIAERMTAQTRGLSMAVRNANDGISLLQTSEGAMDEVSNILQRMRELAVQSVNGTNNDSDRIALNDEVQQLKAEIERIATTTEFNNIKLLDGSFKDKKLQIGDKGYQTMDIKVDSMRLKDLGMSPASFGSETLVSTRIGLTATTTFAKGDVMVNGQELDALAANSDMEDLIKNINDNVDNVTATGFNTVVAKQIGTGVTTSDQFKIQVKALGATTTTTYAISAANSLQELVDNINKEVGGQVTASINDSGKLVLSNDTGADILVNDSSATGNYETASGFLGAAANSYTRFKGFLQLESKDGSPIRIERGNLEAQNPGALTDLQVLGFREITSEFNKANDAYTITGSALTSAGVSGAWDQKDIKINGVAIYDEDIATTSFQGKLDAINNFSEKTGVIAYARYDSLINLTARNFSSTTAAVTLKFNGVTAYTAAGGAAGKNATAVIHGINQTTIHHGLTAALEGNNIRLTGTNVQSLHIDLNSTATAKFGISTGTTYASIRLDSVKDTPISIELGDSHTAVEHGFFEMNVGAADFMVNAAEFGPASGTSLSGLNVNSASSATKAISVIDNAIETVSSARSKLGAMENRLISTVNNLTNIVTNTEASKSRILDTDYAKETTSLAKSQIIAQAATAMLAQANQAPQGVLALLQ